MMLNRPAETGQFGLGLTLSLGFFAIYNAYSEYLSVRVRALEHVRDVARFLKVCGRRSISSDARRYSDRSGDCRPGAVVR